MDLIWFDHVLIIIPAPHPDKRLRLPEATRILKDNMSKKNLKELQFVHICSEHLGPF